MSELDDLKRKLAEIGLIFKILIQKKLKGLDKLVSKKIPNKTVRLALGIVLLSFIFGFFFGSLITGGGGSSPASGAKQAGFSIVRFLFGKSIPVPGKQADGSFVLADFEKDEALMPWTLQATRLELSQNHAVEGEQSAEVTYYGGQQIASFFIADYFESRNGLSNWEDYEMIEFYIYNPRQVAERMIFQLKDKRNNRFKENLHIPGGQGQVFRIPLDRVAGSMNIRDIDSVQFFLWEPRGDREFYFDNIRLLPKGYAAEAKDKAFHRPVIKERPVNPLDFGFQKRKSAWLAPDQASGAQVVRVPFIIHNETPGVCAPCYGEGGVPFPMGEVKSTDQIRLRDPQGNLIPFQSRVLGKWPDGSVKWAGLHFEANLPPAAGGGLFLEYSPELTKTEFKGLLEVKEDGDRINVITGPMKAELSKNQFFLFKRVWLDQNQNKAFEESEVLTEDAPLVLSFMKEEYRADLDRKSYIISVEESGPLKTVIKASGWFLNQDGKKFCQAIVRYYFYSSSTAVKVSHTLIYTGYPENKYNHNYKQMKLPPNEPIDSFGFRIPFKQSGQGAVTVGELRQASETFALEERFEFVQTEWDKHEVKTGGPSGVLSQPAAGWFDLTSDQYGVTVALRHFLENSPKAFRANKDGIAFDLWPGEAGKLDLSTTTNAFGPEAVARGSAFGLGKTHDMLILFHDSKVPSGNLLHAATAFMEPLQIRVNPYWIHSTGALGRLYPADPKFATEENIVEKMFDWAARQQRDFKWYGMLNFGDTLSWWRNSDGKNDTWYGSFGWHPVGRWGWYNCEGVGLHTGALLQFVRSGKYKYFDFGENSAKHIMDVDTVHYNTIDNDPRIKNILNDRFSQVGSMHRHNGDHWGGRNEESTHTSVVGILLYYYLSGNERALDVAKEIGSFFLKEPFTYDGHPDIAPHRGMANALWGDVLLFELTGDKKYKNAADRIIEIYLKGQQSDGSFLETYNPLDQTWNGNKHTLYMHDYALGAFIEYHRLTQDKEVEEMLVKMVRFLGVMPAAMHGNAYAFFLTGDPQFIKNIEAALAEVKRHAHQSSDSLVDGLIYDKPIYHRANTFLYTIPYSVEALEASAALPPPAA